MISSNAVLANFSVVGREGALDAMFADRRGGEPKERRSLDNVISATFHSYILRDGPSSLGNSHFTLRRI